MAHRKQSKATSREQRPGDVTAHCAPCAAEGRLEQPWHKLGDADRCDQVQCTQGVGAARLGFALAAPSGPAPVAKVLDVKLYDQPNAQPSAFCDRYTTLVHGQEGDEFVATLNHELSATSACEIAVMPGPRSYTVRSPCFGVVIAAVSPTAHAYVAR